MGIPDLLNYLQRNLDGAQEATVRTRHGSMDWFEIGKEYVKAVYCHPAYLTCMQNTSCEMPGWMKHKLESRLQGEISRTSDMQMAPSEEEFKEPCDEGKEKRGKVGLNLNIQKTKIIESSSITSWQ